MLLSITTFTLVLAFALFTSRSLADPSVTWVLPPPSGKAGDFSNNEVVRVGAVMDVVFQTDAKSFDVVIWQAGVRSPVTLKSNTTETSFSWVVDVSGFNVPITPHGDILGNVCYLGVTNLQDAPSTTYFTSHYINITSPDTDAWSVTAPQAQKPTAAPAEDLRPNQSISIASTPSATPSASSTTTTNPMSATQAVLQTYAATGQLSSGQAAGIGIGVAFGVLAVAGGIIAFLWRQRSQQRAMSNYNEMSSVTTGGNGNSSGGVMWSDPKQKWGANGSYMSKAGSEESNNSAVFRKALPIDPTQSSMVTDSSGGSHEFGRAPHYSPPRYEMGDGAAAEMDGRAIRELPT